MIDEMARLMAMRERVYRCIEDELDRDGHHKSYEGAWEVTMSIPEIFSRGEPIEWTVTLHCYVLDLSGRHEHWTGRTLAEAIAKAEHSINKICSPYEHERFAKRMANLENVDGEYEGDGGTTYGPTRSEEMEADSIPE